MGEEWRCLWEPRKEEWKSLLREQMQGWMGENYRHAGEAGLCPSGCEAPSR